MVPIMGRRRVCIATWELRPFTGGGIGTLVHNLLKAHNPEEVELSILWYGDRNLLSATFHAIFPGCQFYRVYDWASSPPIGPPRESYLTSRQSSSFELMIALKRIEAEFGEFDVVEFPDFAGVAYACLQEKLLGRAFQKTQIGVRLHSTESALRRYDHRPPDLSNAFVSDMERKALLDADFVVAHLRPVAEDVASHFDFSEDWIKKVRCELPPVFVGADAKKRCERFDADTPLVFSSKIQWFKRPHTFINAVVAFMRTNPDYTGSAYLLAHIVDVELLLHCKDLVPLDLAARFNFLDRASSELRDSLISRGIVIFPTAYESFCLASYEAELLGAHVILNEANPAFGEETPWQEGRNCSKFAETADSLRGQLSKLWQRKDLRRESVKLAPFRARCWEAAESTSKDWNAQYVTKLRRSLSLVIVAPDGAGDLLETLTSALDVRNFDLEIIISCDVRPSEPHLSAVLDRLVDRTDCSQSDIMIYQLNYRGELAALCNQGVSRAKHEMIAIARAGTTFNKDFLIDAVDALASNGKYDFVIPQRCFKDTTKPNWASVDRVRIGEALSSGVIENLFGDIEFVARKSTVMALRFDEDLDRYTDWDFHMRACAAGHRYIVSNYVEAYAEPISGRSHFRAHLDGVLVKHVLPTRGGRISLATAFDRGAATDSNDSHLFARRPISYYLNERRDWKKIALRQPLKPLRWLMLREVQKRKK